MLKPEQKLESEEMGRHTPCADFDTFKPLFKDVQQELKAGLRSTSHTKMMQQ